MQTFSITGVDQQGVEGILANPLPGVDFGSLVGRPVQFARKVVGHVARIYRDSLGPWVAKVQLDDMNALRLSATGCLTALTVGPEGVEMRDRVEDHGQTFEYTKADGSKLAKSFRGLSVVESEQALLQTHLAKLPPTIRKSANQEFAELLVKGTDMAPRPYRKPGKDSRSTWPNSTPSISAAREIVPNRNSRV